MIGVIKVGAAVPKKDGYPLAKKVGTDKTYISRIEKGVIEPGVGMFFRIAEALGLRVDIVRPLM